MNKWSVLAFIWLLVVVQATVLATIRPWGIVPQLWLVGLVFVAASRSLALTLTAALWGSWWLMALSAIHMEIWLVMYPLTAVLVYFVVRAGIEIGKLSGLIIVLALALIVTNLTTAATLALTGGELAAIWPLARVMGLEIGLTLMLAWLIRPLVQSVVRPVN